MKDAIQFLLLVIILILQVTFTGISLDKAHEITVGDIVTMIEVILILFGFFIAYRQIVFSYKISEANKIWEKICLLESSYIVYRASIAKKILDFIKMAETDTGIGDNNNGDNFSEYVIGIVKTISEFEIKLKGVSDQILYKNVALDAVIDVFLKKEKDRIQKIAQEILIVLTSKLGFGSKETCELGREISGKIIDDYKQRFNSIMTIFEDNDFIKFRHW